MSIQTKIVGTGGVDRRSKREAEIHPLETAQGAHSGLVVLTEPLVQGEPSTDFFQNGTFGIAMNQNVAFSGTPDAIHDGTDKTLWTGSALQGTKFTFADGDHAHQAVATVITFGNLTGETVTVVVDGTTTVYTESVEWENDTSNNATATSIASAISANAKIASSTASGAVVTIVANAGLDITSFTTNADAGDMTTAAQAVKINSAVVNDAMQFAKGSDIDLNNYTAITLQIYVDKDWANDDSVELYGFDTDSSIEVGLRVKLEDYFSFGEFDQWHGVVIPLTDLGLDTATTVDAFRIQIVQKQSSSPIFYIDLMQVEQTGTPAVYEIIVPLGDRFHIHELTFAYADALTGTVSNGTMPGISYDKLLGVSSLTNGFTITRKSLSETLFSATIHNIGEHIAAGAILESTMSDGTNTFIILKVRFTSPLLLIGRPGDSLTIQINDDLSGLLRFTASARGFLEFVPKT